MFIVFRSVILPGNRKLYVHKHEITIHVIYMNIPFLYDWLWYTDKSGGFKSLHVSFWCSTAEVCVSFFMSLCLCLCLCVLFFLRVWACDHICVCGMYGLLRSSNTLAQMGRDSNFMS